MLLGEDYWKSIKSEPAEWEQFFGAPDLGDFERRGVRLKWSRPGWSGWQIFLKIGQVGLSTTLCAATIIKSKGNIGKITQDIMDTETPCRNWLKGDCWKHRKGSCDLAHIKKFCQNGTNKLWLKLCQAHVKVQSRFIKLYRHCIWVAFKLHLDCINIASKLYLNCI